MAKGDFQPFDTANSKFTGAVRYYVKAGSKGADGTVSRIQSGELVTKAAGATGVLAAVTNAPTTTLRVVGIAAEVSNETASVDGSVSVIPADNGQIWMVLANVAATWNTQAKYNALCGSRILIDNTSGVYTALAADGASNGCIVEYLDVAKYPGMVAFSFSPLVDYRNV